MNISDEWEPPAKQPFKDFVSITPTFLSYVINQFTMLHVSTVIIKSFINE